MRSPAVVSLALLVPPLFAADIPPPTGGAIVAADAKWEVLFTRSAKISGGLTEGPAAAPDGSIYFSDIPVGNDKGMTARSPDDKSLFHMFSIYVAGAAFHCAL